MPSFTMTPEQYLDKFKTFAEAEIYSLECSLDRLRNRQESLKPVDHYTASFFFTMEMSLNAKLTKMKNRLATAREMCDIAIQNHANITVTDDELMEMDR